MYFTKTDSSELPPSGCRQYVTDDVEKTCKRNARTTSKMYQLSNETGKELFTGKRGKNKRLRTKKNDFSVKTLRYTIIRLRSFT